ncbi:MAG TPA: hypothetical protein VGO16_05905 [Pseudonocardiaceae bacterium]|nr:hypothetical protein [Pseudonocardiaceae bacterium]
MQLLDLMSPSPAATPAPRHDDLAYLTHDVEDTERARAFYGAVLGWTFVPGRVEDGWQIEGTYPPAGMHGGADQAGIEPAYQVDDLTAVRDHGGQTREPQQQPYGRIAECTDNQGAHSNSCSRDRRRAPTRHSVGARVDYLVDRAPEQRGHRAQDGQ